MLLTMQGGLLSPISWLFGKIMDIIYNILAVDGVANLGLCIILFTVVVKILLFPLNLKTQKSTKINSMIQPEIQKIQKKYKNKTDQESMLQQNHEINAVYQKYGTNMTAGCLPSLIQFPIIFGLYDVVRNIPAYVTSIKKLYTPIADSLINADFNVQDVLTKFVEDNKISTATQAVKSLSETSNLNNSIIDVLDKFSTAQWADFQKLTEISSNADIISAINGNIDKIQEINNFMFGINISDAPGLKLTIALFIPIISTLMQFISMLISMKQSKQTNGDNQMANSMMKSMMFMPIMSFFMCALLPAGIGIYWSINSLISLIIQVGMNYYYDHIVDMDKMLAKMQEKAEKKNAGKGDKKSFMEKLMEASGQGEPSEAPISRQVSNKNLRNYDTKKINSVNQTGKSYKPGSMAAKANIMLNYDDMKGKEK